MPDNKKDNKNCVQVNIFVKCKDGSWKKDKDETCVDVNIYAECEECEKKRKNECEEY